MVVLAAPAMIVNCEEDAQELRASKRADGKKPGRCRTMMSQRSSTITMTSLCLAAWLIFEGLRATPDVLTMLDLAFVLFLWHYPDWLAKCCRGC